jgi:integrase
MKPADWRRNWGLHPAFPLFPLPAAVYPGKPDHRRWAKKVRGKLHYFGKIESDPKGEAALVEWLRVKDDLIAGKPRPSKDGEDRLTLRELCNEFLAAKRAALKSGSVAPRTFSSYHRTTDLLIATFGRDAAVEDFGPPQFSRLYAKLAERHDLLTLGSDVALVRAVFNWSWKNARIGKPITFGTLFKQPSKGERRKHKAAQKNAGHAKLFAADEIRRMIDAAGPQLKAMILLGINCGYGNTDCAKLPLSALNLNGGWIDFPRPKTGIERRAKLWPEAVAALRVVIANRKPPRDAEHANLVFLQDGRPWVRFFLQELQDEQGRLSVKRSQQDGITKATAKLLTQLGIKRPGLSFYALRHNLETIGGDCRDQVAVDAIMGHVDGTMAGQYRERIEDARLQAVVNHVHEWLFPSEPAKASKAKETSMKAMGRPRRSEKLRQP